MGDCGGLAPVPVRGAAGQLLGQGQAPAMPEPVPCAAALLDGLFEHPPGKHQA